MKVEQASLDYPDIQTPIGIYDYILILPQTELGQYLWYIDL